METFYHTRVSVSQIDPDGGGPLGLRNLFIKLLHGHVSARGVNACGIGICFGLSPEVDVYSTVKGSLEALIEDLSHTGLFREHLAFSSVSVIDGKTHQGKWLEVIMLRPPRKNSFSKLAKNCPADRAHWADQRKKELERLPYFVGRSNSSGHAFKNYVKTQVVDSYKGFNVNSYGLGTLNASLTVPQVRFESQA